MLGIPEADLKLCKSGVGLSADEWVKALNE